MSYYYDYYDSFGSMFDMFYGTFTLISLAFGILAYVLRSLSLQTIAGRRGLEHSWLAWIPVASDWLLGSVSDQYKYLTQEKNQSRRKLLLGLSIASAVCVAAIWVQFISVLIQVITYSESYYSDAQMAQLMLRPIMGILLIGLAGAVVSVTAYVVRCMCKYDLYRSCNPQNATTFLVLGILFNVTEPFFLFYCRKKDQGMPPRRPEPQEPWEM